jgi:hypothetical protein
VPVAGLPSPATPLPIQPSPAKAQQPAPPQPASGDGPFATLPGGGACDVRACSERYTSFRAADCTYQPFGGGPRQVCTASGVGGDDDRRATQAYQQPPPRVAQQPAPPPARPPARTNQQVPQSIIDWLRGQPGPGY